MHSETSCKSLPQSPLIVAPFLGPASLSEPFGEMFLPPRGLRESLRRLSGLRESLRLLSGLRRRGLREPLRLLSGLRESLLLLSGLLRLSGLREAFLRLSGLREDFLRLSGLRDFFAAAEGSKRFFLSRTSGARSSSSCRVIQSRQCNQQQASTSNSRLARATAEFVSDWSYNDSDRMPTR